MSEENGNKRYPAILYYKASMRGVSDDSTYFYNKIQIGTGSKPIDYQTLVESVNMDKFRELFDSNNLFDTIEFITESEYEANK